MKVKAAAGATSDLASQAVDVAGIRVLAVRLESFDAKALREAVDRLKQQLVDAVVVLAGATDGKAALVAGVSGAAAGQVKAGELLSHIAAQIGGKGGGRPDLAQGGGEDGPALKTGPGRRAPVGGPARHGAGVTPCRLSNAPFDTMFTDRQRVQVCTTDVLRQRTARPVNGDYAC